MGDGTWNQRDSEVVDGAPVAENQFEGASNLVHALPQDPSLSGMHATPLFAPEVPADETQAKPDTAAQVDPKNPTTITAEVVKEIMIFEMKEVLHMSAIGVDLDYAAKGTV